MNSGWSAASSRDVWLCYNCCNCFSGETWWTSSIGMQWGWTDLQLKLFWLINLTQLVQAQPQCAIPTIPTRALSQPSPLIGSVFLAPRGFISSCKSPLHGSIAVLQFTNLWTNVTSIFPLTQTPLKLGHLRNSFIPTNLVHLKDYVVRRWWALLAGVVNWQKMCSPKISPPNLPINPSYSTQFSWD